MHDGNPAAAAEEWAIYLRRGAISNPVTLTSNDAVHIAETLDALRNIANTHWDTALSRGDEIQRLESELGIASRVASNAHLAIADLTAENERLRAAHNVTKQVTDDLAGELDTAEARYERARPVLDAALEWHGWGIAPHGNTLETALINAVETFRAATEDQNGDQAVIDLLKKAAADFNAEADKAFANIDFDAMLAKIYTRAATVTDEERAAIDAIDAEVQAYLLPLAADDTPTDLSGQPIDPWARGCPTCTGPTRETVGMVCQTCGTDYGHTPTGEAVKDADQ